MMLNLIKSQKVFLARASIKSCFRQHHPIVSRIICDWQTANLIGKIYIKIKKYYTNTNANIQQKLDVIDKKGSTTISKRNFGHFSWLIESLLERFEKNIVFIHFNAQPIVRETLCPKKCFGHFSWLIESLSERFDKTCQSSFLIYSTWNRWW